MPGQQDLIRTRPEGSIRMKYIVFDLEWNQCPTGKEHEDPLLPFEILEIGACRLNERLEQEDSFHSFVSPKVYKTLHYMTRRVIHLTKADLKNQPSFPEACARFFEWCGSDCVFCSWGPSDLYELQNNAPMTGEQAAFMTGLIETFWEEDL